MCLLLPRLALAPIPDPPFYFSPVRDMATQHPRVASVQMQAPLLDGCVHADMLVQLHDGRQLVVELGNANSVFLGPSPTDWTPSAQLRRAALAAEGYDVLVPMDANEVLTWKSLDDLLHCVQRALDSV